MILPIETKKMQDCESKNDLALDLLRMAL